MSGTKGTKSGIKPMLDKLEVSLAEKDWYTSHQLYKALYSRYSQTNQFQELRDLMVSGASRLLDENEIAAGSELALLLLEHYKRDHVLPNAESFAPLLQIFSHYKVGNKHPSKLSFIRHAVKWSANADNHHQGAPELHSIFARSFYEAQEYDLAHEHFIRSNDPETFSLMLHSHAECGYSSERDLFLTRAVLLYLTLGNLKDANTLFSCFMNISRQNQPQQDVSSSPVSENNNPEVVVDSSSTHSSIFDSPLINFCRFLLLTLERDALPLFNQLRANYAKSLRRDPSFNKYLDQIAYVFGGSKPAPTGVEGLFGNLVSSFMNQPNEGDELRQGIATDVLNLPQD